MAGPIVLNFDFPAMPRASTEDLVQAFDSQGDAEKQQARGYGRQHRDYDTEQGRR